MSCQESNSPSGAEKIVLKHRSSGGKIVILQFWDTRWFYRVDKTPVTFWTITTEALFHECHFKRQHAKQAIGLGI